MKVFFHRYCSCYMYRWWLMAPAATAASAILPLSDYNVQQTCDGWCDAYVDDYMAVALNGSGEFLYTFMMIFLWFLFSICFIYGFTSSRIFFPLLSWIWRKHSERNDKGWLSFSLLFIEWMPLYRLLHYAHPMSKLRKISFTS